MNLFFNPSEKEFQKFLSNVGNNKSTHDLVVDYDGEVLVDPQLQQPGLDLSKFKVRLQLSEHIKRALKNKPSRLRNLFRSILNAWNNDAFAGNLFALY